MTSTMKSGKTSTLRRADCVARNTDGIQIGSGALGKCSPQHMGSGETSPTASPIRVCSDTEGEGNTVVLINEG